MKNIFMKPFNCLIDYAYARGNDEKDIAERQYHDYAEIKKPVYIFTDREIFRTKTSGFWWFDMRCLDKNRKV